MIMSIDDKINELLLILDRDIQHIQKSLSRLDDLRCFVIKRDDESLLKLLENIQSETNSYRENELRRGQLREELASEFGCGAEQITLSRLEAKLSGEKKVEVAEKKHKLRLLVGKLKKEHFSTMMLLSDCARFNRMLLKSIFEFGRGGITTYSPRGLTENQTGTALMDIQY
jgi:hypothetical protein